MSSSPFPKPSKASSSTNHNVVARERRSSILPMARRLKVELPGTTERHNYIEIQTRSTDQSPPMVLDLPSIGIKVQNGSSSSSKNSNDQNDECLLTLAVSRLHAVKTQLDLSKLEVHEAHEGIRRRDDTIKELKQQISKMQTIETKHKSELDSSKMLVNTSDYRNLLEKCDFLENQVSEMDAFFQDYGLTFVGDRGQPDDDDMSQQSNEFTVDFDKLVRNVEMLNVYAREGESQMVLTNQGATFKMPESVPLVLYSNGIVLFSGPFRDYDDFDTEIFIRDLLDGFFPSELQRSYPDGVPFKLVDKRDVIYQDQRLIFKTFSGTGHRLGRANPVPPSKPTEDDTKPIKIHVTRITDMGPIKEPRINQQTNTIRNDDITRRSVSDKSVQIVADSRKVSTNSVNSDSSIFKSCGNVTDKIFVSRLNQKLVKPNQTPNKVKSKPRESLSKDHNSRAHGDLRDSSSDAHIRDAFQEEYSTRLLNNSLRDSNNGSIDSTIGRWNHGTLRDRLSSFDDVSRSVSKCSLDKNDSDGYVDWKRGQDLEYRRNVTNKMRVEKNLKTKRLSADSFLKKLPSVVIRKGKIVDIRGELSEFCKDSKQHVNEILVKKDEVDAIQLKIKANGGNDLLLVNISPNRTIGELRTCLGSALGEETRRAGFELYGCVGTSNKFAPLCFYYRKLSDCGLTRNTMLYLEPDTKNVSAEVVPKYKDLNRK